MPNDETQLTVENPKSMEVFHRKKHNDKQKSTAAQEMLFSELSNPDQIVLPVIGGASSEASEKKNVGRVAFTKRVSVANSRSETVPGVMMHTSPSAGCCAPAN